MPGEFFHSRWNVLDGICVLSGWVNQVAAAYISEAGLEKVAVLKLLRMLRLLRLVRLLVAFREIYVLVSGITRCMKTMWVT